MKWSILLALASTCAILAFARPVAEPLTANMPTVSETRAILLDCERRHGRQCVVGAVPVMSDRSSPE